MGACYKNRAKLNQLKEDEFFGYGVNTGMGCFMDNGVSTISPSL
ncbi:DUF4241 domain-containing protein [Bacillus safensis]|nr:DUF4241 domain-containing protein [Bacillus safensis]